MVHLLDLQDVKDGHGHIDIYGDHCLEHFVKTERSDLLVVVVLRWYLNEKSKSQKPVIITFIDSSLQLSSSDSSMQFDV